MYRLSVPLLLVDDRVDFPNCSIEFFQFQILYQLQNDFIKFKYHIPPNLHPFSHFRALSPQNHTIFIYPEFHYLHTIVQMEGALLLNCNFRGESKLIQIDPSMSFIHIVQQVSGTWSVLSDGNFSLRFESSRIQNCVLESEADFKNMLFMCQHTGEKIVNVHVNLGCIGSSSRNSPPLDQNSHSSIHSKYSLDVEFTGVSADRETVEDLRRYEVEDIVSIPNYEMCPIETPKSYLSDHWLEIFKHGVGSKIAGGAPEFRKELIKYNTRLGFKFRYQKNDNRYVAAVCDGLVNSQCNWFIKAKRTGGKNPNFVVYKACLQHNCMGTLLSQSNGRFGKRIIGDLVEQKVRAKPTLSPKDLVSDFYETYGVEISYSKAWKAIEIAREGIWGSYDESYDHLRWYCEAISRTNPGSIVDLEKNNSTNEFERVFVAFKCSVDGFRKCRPMLFIDGTFMKGRARGTLLTATAKDGENCLYPVALAIVSAENTDNWSWFLSKLRDGVEHEKPIFYLSDRNTGLMAAFPRVFEAPLYFFCLYHLMNNLKGRFAIPNLVDHFKDCAYAPNYRLFQEKLAVFKLIGGEKAAEWIDELPFHKWAVAHMPGFVRYGEMTSNAAESFNSWIREDRALPITYMLDSIRKKICKWYEERRDDSAKWTGALCPRKEALWNRCSDVGKSWLVQKGANGQFEVASKISATVDLNLKICTCYQWQLQGFPCAHAVAVIRRYCTTIYGHIDEFYLAKNYRECYQNDINPIPQTEKYECQATYEDDKVSPPVLNRPAGRPKKKRISSFGEWPKKKPFSCKRCFKTGRHDMVTCALETCDRHNNDEAGPSGTNEAVPSGTNEET